MLIKVISCLNRVTNSRTSNVKQVMGYNSRSLWESKEGCVNCHGEMFQQRRFRIVHSLMPLTREQKTTRGLLYHHTRSGPCSSRDEAIAVHQSVCDCSNHTRSCTHQDMLLGSRQPTKDEFHGSRQGGGVRCMRFFFPRIFQPYQQIGHAQSRGLFWLSSQNLRYSTRRVYNAYGDWNSNIVVEEPKIQLSSAWHERGFQFRWVDKVRLHRPIGNS